MACVGSCGIYKSRPQFCRDYPRVQDFVPSGCTFHFVGEERRGSCRPKECGNEICCAWPREGGEPEGTSLDSLAGGEPCKHLKWEELDAEKTASIDDPESVDLETSVLINEFLRDM
jgi:Fe-S-cluster containining protein